MMNHNMKNFFKSRNGVVLAVVMLVIGVITIISASFISLAVSSTYSFRKWKDVDRAFLTAQSAIEITKQELYDELYSYYISDPRSRSAYKFDWFGSTTTTPSFTLGKTGYIYDAMTNREVLYGTASVVFEGLVQQTLPIRGPCDVKITAVGYVGDTQFELTEIVRYKLSRSKVFDYAYFVNNFGWFWGSSITVTGDVRANGNFSFKYGPDIYGDAYAAVNPDIGAGGYIWGTYDSFDLATYLTKNSGDWLYTRPGSPTAIPDNWKDATYWDMGYNGNPVLYDFHEKVDMPYLGDIGEYRDIAEAYDGGKGSTLTFPQTTFTGSDYTLDTHTNDTINGVYDGDGPDGLSGTDDDGCLVLVGTYDNPIVIDGPVVVKKDLIIKGYFTGQGTIYVRRNTHIMGDLIAVDPPVWDKPDTNPEGTAADNREKDFLALASKGNTVLGDYTSSDWYNNIKYYIYPNGSFCQPYETDATDVENGYDSDKNDNNGYRFDGDYRLYDGGRYVNDETLGTSLSRRYYQSSINRTRFTSYADSSLLSQVDAVLYNNHLIVGYVGDMEFNGGIVSRNEAINFSGSPMINWDIRMGSTSKDAMDIDLYLPVSLSPPETLYWYQN